jgi:hypothetical protein
MQIGTRRGARFLRRRRVVVLTVASVVFGPVAFAQSASTSPDAEEIPIERCDRLPIVKVHVGGTELRFLVDTGATTMLNMKSFASGRVKQIDVTSWRGTDETSAREVSLPELRLGTHSVKALKLPAIDLSAIGNACGGPVDGILGIDLLEKMGVTLDLRRQIASLESAPLDAKSAFDDMERQMGPCTISFEQGHADEFRECLDPEIVLYTPHGEFHGRDEVIEYMKREYFVCAPNLHYATSVHDMKLFGNAIWYTYDFDLDTPKKHTEGHGMAMCRKTGGRWRILNMHNSLRENEEGKATAKERAEP